jgi:hypothetical protein
MYANRFNGYTDYGVGIGLRVPHYDHILSKKPIVDWFEIISENYMIDGGRPLKILDQILDQYRVVQHGVSMYFGSAQALNRDHLKRIKELTNRTNTPWLSDHLCWGSVDAQRGCENQSPAAAAETAGGLAVAVVGTSVDLIGA